MDMEPVARAVAQAGRAAANGSGGSSTAPENRVTCAGDTSVTISSTRAGCSSRPAFDLHVKSVSAVASQTSPDS